jgi:hypothetical protein
MCPHGTVLAGSKAGHHDMTHAEVLSYRRHLESRVALVGHLNPEGFPIAGSGASSIYLSASSALGTYIVRLIGGA